MNHIPKIIIKLIDPASQRYSECGDWFFDAEDNTVTVFVTRMEDWRSELAVAIHEAMEAVMCIADEVDQTDVDFHDKQFYKDHHDDDMQAGDDPKAPYFLQHVAATFVEKETVSQLKLDWKRHEEICDA